MLRILILMIAIVLPLFGKEWKEIETTELYLKNGMHVVLHPVPNCYEEDDIHIALSALGGYTVLPYDQRAIGQIAPAVAWESGVGPMTTDQLTVMLYENCLEFNLQIDPFWRGVEGKASAESLPAFFKVVHLFFTRPQFDETIFKRAVESAKIAANHPIDYDRAFEETFIVLNTQNYAGFRTVQASELDNLTLDQVKKFFIQAFSNPAEFTLVISGNFKIDEVLPEIEKYLGVLDSKVPSKPWKMPSLGDFPYGTTTKVLPTKRSIGTTRIAFPVQSKITAEQILCIDDWCHIIEARLRSALLKKSLSSRGIDVSYEFPYYPYMTHAWLTIQYQSDFKQISDINELIFNELKKIKSDGITKWEVEKAKTHRQSQIATWYDEPEYWTPVLSNHVLWGWDLDSRSKKSTGLETHALPLIKEFSELIPLDQYTQISTQTGK